MPEYGNLSMNMFLCFGLLTLSCDGVACQYFADAVVLKWNLCLYMLVPIDPYLQIHQSEHKNFQSPLVLSYTYEDQDQLKITSLSRWETAMSLKHCLICPSSHGGGTQLL